MNINKKKSLPTVASFLISEDCNMACTYCFELEGRRSKHMSKEVARKSVEFLVDNALQSGENSFEVMFFGGEPLLKPEIVEEVFEHGVELAEKYNLEFRTSMVTNATLLDDNIERILRKYRDKTNLNVQLSVDGIKKIHDHYRITRAGEGTFDLIESKIEQWKSIFADNIHALSVHGCSNHDTLPYLFENYKFFREEWDIPRIWFMPIHSEEWAEKDLEVYDGELSKIADYVLEKTRETGNMQEVINYAPIDRCLSPDSFPHAPCGAGKNFITITASGELYPCHQIYFQDPEKITKIGTLEKGIDYGKVSLFAEYSNDDLSCAKADPDCDAYHCYRCIGENWGQNGSILSTVDMGGVRCKMSKIERNIQVRVRKELEKMGLLNSEKQQNNFGQGNNPNNPDCLCDSRGTPHMLENSKPQGGSTCQCGGGDSDLESAAMALAMKLLLEKVGAIEKNQKTILEKL